jgi:hypothetical protein
MKLTRKVIGSFALLICFSLAVPMATAVASRASVVTKSSASSADEDRMLEPSDLFRDFPEIKLGMSFPDARQAIEKTGAHPVAFRNAKTELAWDGTFDGVSGRATVLFKEAAGAYEIAVIAHASDERGEVFARWLKLIVEKHGAPKEDQDTSVDTSKVWRLKDGVALELRLIKDDDSPVIDIHWVKE